MPGSQGGPSSLGRAGRGKPKPYDPNARASTGTQAGEKSRPAAPGPDPSEKPIGRRAVIAILGLGALGIAYGEHVQDGITDLLSPLRSSGLANLVPGGGRVHYLHDHGRLPGPASRLPCNC